MASKLDYTNKYCPICGNAMKLIRPEGNFVFSTELYKCQQCNIEYNGMLSFRTDSKSAAEKCSMLGYKVIKQTEDYGGGWSIRNYE
jgi:transposase-like protein